MTDRKRKLQGLAMTGRGYGGRGGHGGRGGDSRNLPPTQRSFQQGSIQPIEVKTNFFKIVLNMQQEWYMYDIQILPAFNRKIVGPDGEFMKDDDGKFIKELEIKKDDNGTNKFLDLGKGSTHLSRRILNKLQEDLWSKNPKKYFVADGNSLGYSPSRLFDQKETDSNVKPASTVGVYGGADDGSQHNRPQAADLGPFKFYHVTVKRDCAEDDPWRDRSKNSHFKVKLTETCALPLSALHDVMNARNSELVEHVSKIMQGINVILNSHMNRHMVPNGRSPCVFHLKEEDHFRRNPDGILGVHLGNKFYQNYSKINHAPLVRLTQAAQLCEGGSMVLANTGLGWFTRDKVFKSDPPQRIPLLDERNKTLAGVPLGSFRDPIRDKATQDAVKDAIRKLTFHVIRENPLTGNDWEQGWRKKGKSESEIKRMNTLVRPNKKMSRPVEGDMSEIYWSACDPSEYSFLLTPREKKNPEGEAEMKHEESTAKEPQGVMHTVESYNESAFKIRLKYPNMPIVHIHKFGYYPVEMLFQVQDRLRGADAVKDALAYNDNFAGTDRIDQIQEVQKVVSSMMEKNGIEMKEIMKEFNFDVSDEPQTFKASVLPPPKLRFEQNDARIDNGSWNLNRARFKSPADLNSFAVINVTGRVDNRKKSVNDFMRNIFDRMKTHGMGLPSGVDLNEALARVTIDCTGPDPEQLYKAFERAMGAARDYFAGNMHTGGFLTNVLFSNGGMSKCLVVSDKSRSSGAGLYAIHSSKNAPTHIITNRITGKTNYARIEYVVGDSSVDPFDDRRSAQQQLGVCYRLIQVNDKGVVVVVDRLPVPETEILDNPRPCFPLEWWQIECPAMVFVYLPEANSESYHFAKLLAHCYFGVSSQCIAQDKYSGQFRDERDGDQYCSNVALKVNTKLFSRTNDARAWTTFDTLHREPVEGIPWVSEVPTLVVGISMSHGIAETVVAGSACLDKGCMQMCQEVKVQHKSDVVEPSVMEEIIQSLAIQYYQHNQSKPLRVLIYRDSGSDGSFPDIRTKEGGAIRKAFYDLNSRVKGFSCPNSDKCRRQGCLFCTPPITFIVAQNDHDIRIVPADRSRNTGPKRNKPANVDSGTVVDSIIMGFRSGMDLSRDGSEEPIVTQCGRESLQMFSDKSDSSFDFLLTAQGGLKGTSKPVYFRVLTNENSVFKVKGSPQATQLTKKNIEKMTYHMAFQYGTATKAPRKVPVILYSERLAQQAHGYISYLVGRETVRGEGNCNLDFGLQVNHDEQGNKVQRHGSYITDKKTGSQMKLSLLEKFGPYNPKCVDNIDGWGVPFHPHIAG